jgi:DNA-binding NarL/FixJ family response regulator
VCSYRQLDGLAECAAELRVLLNEQYGGFHVLSTTYVQIRVVQVCFRDFACGGTPIPEPAQRSCIPLRNGPKILPVTSIWSAARGGYTRWVTWVLFIKERDSSMPSVLIADDHEIFRIGLRDMLSGRFEIVAEASNGLEAVEKTLSSHPDVAVLDVFMPEMNGIEAAREIKARSPETAIVMISAIDEEGKVFESAQAGVSGYVVKDDDPRNLVQAIQNASEGKAYLPPLIAKRVMEGVAGSLRGRRDMLDRGGTPLTIRELAVLRLLAIGKRNREISIELSISERTVGNHISGIYQKLHIYDRSQAIVYAIKTGIVRA